MSSPTPTPSAAPPDRRLAAGAGAVLAVAIVVPLLVWLYAREDPALFGIPFFYWFQFALVFVSVAATSLAYRLITRYDRQRDAFERARGEL